MVLTYLKNHTGPQSAQGGGENTYCITQTVFQTLAKGHMLKLIGFNYKSLLHLLQMLLEKKKKKQFPEALYPLHPPSN